MVVSENKRKLALSLASSVALADVVVVVVGKR